MRVVCSLILGLISVSAWGQSQRPVLPTPAPVDDFSSYRPSNSPTSAGAEYRIGKDDLIEVTVFEVPELNGTGRVTASGSISLPLIGMMEAAGRTPAEMERLIAQTLKKNYLNDPHVTVFVREYASQPVSIMGAVRVPGIYQIKGQKFLLEMLAMAQGIDVQNAGNVIQIMRRKDQEDGQTISVSVQDLLQNGKSQLNIPIQAGDVINVLQANSVFVIGEVNRPGEVILRQGRDITAAQALANGGGFTKEAKKTSAVIIRIHQDRTRQEIPVNIKKILDGSIDDVTLMPNDILFVPANRFRSGLARALESSVAIVTGRLIY